MSTWFFYSKIFSKIQFHAFSNQKPYFSNLKTPFTEQKSLCKHFCNQKRWKEMFYADSALIRDALWSSHSSVRVYLMRGWMSGAPLPVNNSFQQEGLFAHRLALVWPPQFMQFLLDICCAYLFWRLFPNLGQLFAADLYSNFWDLEGVAWFFWYFGYMVEFCIFGLKNDKKCRILNSCEWSNFWN
jgi:hypothetical protein